MLKFNDVTCSFGDHVVVNRKTISFEACTFITGPSGSGKTTYLKLLLGLIKPDTGQVVTEKETLRAVFSGDALLEHMSAWDNCYRMTKSMWTNKEESRQNLFRLFQTVFWDEEDEQKLRHRLFDIPVSGFSKGMRRKVAIVRALYSYSTCIVMDEPMSGLDERSVDCVMDAISKYLLGRKLVIATHNQKLCEKFPHSELKLD